MEKKFCAAAGRSITPNECGTFDACGNISECKVRKYYEKHFGWLSGQSKGSQPKPERVPEPQASKHRPEPVPAADTPEAKDTNRTCNMCARDLDIVNFRDRKDGRGKKKTCSDCEDRYVTKTAPKKGYAGQKGRTGKKAGSPTAKPKAKPEPRKNNQPKKQANLEGFDWINNTFRVSGEPGILISERDITFNAAARRRFEKRIAEAETVDIGVKKNGEGKAQIAFVPHADMCGQYRLQRGGQRNRQIRVHVKLSAKGYVFGKGPWALQEVDGVFLAEVGE